MPAIIGLTTSHLEFETVFRHRLEAFFIHPFQASPLLRYRVDKCVRLERNLPGVQVMKFTRASVIITSPS